MSIKKGWQWLKDNSDPIIAVATSLQLLGIVAGVVAVFLTWTQVNDARNALRASTEFQILHNGHRLAASLAPDAYAYIYQGAEASSDVQSKAQHAIARILQHYYSIWLLYSEDILDPGFWSETKKEICFFLHHRHVQPVWELVAKSYPVDFVKAGQSCFAETQRHSAS